MGKETIEEAAERLFPVILEDDGSDKWDKNKQYRDEWIEGAKWQKESTHNNIELYSEIEHLIIAWNIDGTKTAGALTRDIIKLLKK